MSDFDARAATWDLDPRKVACARDVAEAILHRAELPAGATALEYGCGTGLLGLTLAPRLGRIVLADSSAGMLEVLAGKLAALGLHHAVPLRLDLTRDPLPEERFDLVCSLLTLHHVDDTAGVLRAFHELVRPGGAVCVADLDREDGSFHGATPHAHRGFDRAWMQRAMEGAGFEGVTLETATHIDRVDAAGRSRDYPVFLACGRRAA